MSAPSSSLTQALAFDPHALISSPPADRVRVRWLGTAGFEIEHQGHVILIDPYVTRASLARCFARPLCTNDELVARYTPRAHAIIAGHTHFDHVLDVPAIARATGATVYGSKSAVNLCRAHGLPASQMQDVEREPGTEPATVESGPFRLRFLPSVHSRFLFGRVPFPGDIVDCDEVPLRTEKYRCGAVFGVEIQVAGRTLYHVGSADLVDGEVKARDVDLALVCVAGWTSTRRYPERVTKALSPKAVLLSHWDSFVRPLSKPPVELPRTRMGELVDRLSASNRDTKIGTLGFLGDLYV